MILNTPYIKCLVKNNYLGLGKGFTNAYIHSMTLLPNRPHFFNVHLESGALYWRLPIQALNHFDWGRDMADCALEPWGVIAKESQIIEIAYLKDYQPKYPRGGVTGQYLFTIEPLQGGFAQIQDQSKALHFLALENGQFALLPNNYLEFRDAHFTNDKKMPRYKRSEAYYRANG